MSESFELVKGHIIPPTPLNRTSLLAPLQLPSLLQLVEIINAENQKCYFHSTITKRLHWSQHTSHSLAEGLCVLDYNFT